MKISIAMATYNGAIYLRQQLDSLALQTLLPKELIVCDDNSTDETMDILRNFQSEAPFEVRIFINERNIGYTKNFEKAISLCRGDLIFMCDQDDVWFKNKIMVVNELAKNESNFPHLSINDAVYSDKNLNYQNVTVLKKTTQTSGINHIHMNGACTAISKEFRDFLLPFPKDLRTNYDTYIHRWGHLLNSRLLINSVLQVWRIHGKNVTSNEMSTPKYLSILQLYKKYRTADVVEDYISYKNDMESMLIMLNDRLDLFKNMNLTQSIDEVSGEIAKIIKSYDIRIKQLSMGFFFRKIIAVQMLIAGQYRYFRGFKSFVKDMLR